MEKLHDLQCNNLQMIQDDEFFPFGTDGVELANFVTGRSTDKAIDIGCGSGIITILLAGKKGLNVVGIEIQKELANLAQRNVEFNKLEDKASILNMRVQDIKSIYKSGSFNIVACNPPYRKVGSGEGSAQDKVKIARWEVELTLGEMLDASAYLLNSGGKFYIVHQTERMDEVICECTKRKLMPKELQVLLPGNKKDPHIFMLKCLKDGKQGLKVKCPRVVYGSTTGDPD